MKTQEEIEKLIFERKNKSHKSLSEYESLEIVRSFNIETAETFLADDLSDAIKKADKIGYPVVVKGVVEGVMHKTEKGLVHPFIRSKDDLYKVIEENLPDCKQFLIQKQVSGIREIALGFVRDLTFGPTVVIAMGGIHSELISDSAFVLAPVEEKKAEEAILRLKSSKMFGTYRGEKPVKMNLLVQLVKKVGEIAINCSSIQELDMNPVIIQKDGTPVVCSALIII
jgi:carbamoylphosphate synthase large subunit